MNPRLRPILASLAALLCLWADAPAADAPRRTTVSIDGRAFHINGKPTYAGRT